MYEEANFTTSNQRANSGVSNKQILQKVTRDIVQCTFEEKSGF